MNETEINSIIHESHKGNPVINWEFITLSDDARLFYHPGHGGNGFDFYGIVRTSKENDEWAPNDWGECIIQGVALFDGARHLYFGDHQTDNFGYDYYPDIGLTIKALTELQNLESRFCNKD